MSLFPAATKPAPATPKPDRRGPLMDRLEKHFREHRYESFTTLDLSYAFPQDKVDSIRNAVRKLIKDKTIKSTGMVRHNKHSMQPQPIGDVVCLTLTIGK